MVLLNRGRVGRRRVFIKALQQCRAFFLTDCRFLLGSYAHAHAQAIIPFLKQKCYNIP